MKFLEYDALEQVNAALADTEHHAGRLFFKVEAYSCKSTSVDKKLLKELHSRTSHDSTYPTQPDSRNSNKGNVSTKLFSYLLGTLNASYADYSFDTVDPAQFKQISPTKALVMIELFLGELHGGQVWESIDTVCDTLQCQLYLFQPPQQFAPDNDSLDQLFLFFYNPTLKRIVFAAARIVR